MQPPTGPPLVPDGLVERAARRFRVLGDPTRLRLLNALRERGEMNVQELTDLLGQRQPNVSKHLGALAREGLVRRRREGVNAYFALNDPGLPGLGLLVTTGVRDDAGG
jgi:ArsR family transcriptional regulator